MLIGQQVGPFEIETDVGNGAMGTVYRAKWQKDGQIVPVALKVISFGLLGNEGAMARFEREAIILKQLRHPHIVRLYATGRIKQTPFIAMEFVDGESLDKILARRGRLFWEDVIAYGRQLCDALQHAHEKGIIHRDLKPSNLMVATDGTLKLTDFGIAKDQDVTSLTGANSTIGTSAYMSPEQCKGDRNLTTKSDLYSLGIVFYELLTGKKPFNGETTVEIFLKHVHEIPVRPCKIVPDLPVWMDNLVMFLLEKDKDHRPIDAATVSRMLADIEEKVAQQQSVGAEMANARRMDRPLGERGINKSDLEIARELRSPGKKRKKRKTATPWYARTWLRAAALLLALLGLGAVGGVLLIRGGDGGSTVPPATMADAWNQVMKSDEPSEKKLQTAAAFLRKYNSDPGPKVEQVRTLYRDLRAERAEEILLKRYHIRGLKNNYEGFDEEAYGQAILALDAEKEGKLPEAARHWNDVRKLQEKFEPPSLPISGDSQHDVLGWVADQHLRLIQKEIPNTLKRLREQLADDRTFERVRDYSAGSAEGLAVRALRAERFGDAPLAKAAWETLAKQSERVAAERKWYLLGTSQAATAKPTDATAADTTTKRLARLETMMKQLHAAWTKVQTDPEASEARLTRRDIRNACRDILALYASDPDESIQRNVADARKLLESVPQ